MSIEDNEIQGAVAAIRQQKQIRGVFNLEGLIRVLSQLEKIDVSYENKTKFNGCLSALFFVVVFVLFIVEQPFFAVVSGMVAIIFLILALHFKNFDLDNGFRQFLLPLLRYLGEDIKPGSDIKVQVELIPVSQKKFFKGCSPKYSKGVYYSCYDHQFERDALSLVLRFYDGNRFKLDVRETLIKMVKTKRISGKIKTKIKFRKLVTHTLQLRIDPNSYRCTTLPQEMQTRHQSKTENILVDKETLQLHDTPKGQILEMSYMAKCKGTEPKKMVVSPDIVPHQLLKIYSYLEPVNPAALEK